ANDAAVQSDVRNFAAKIMEYNAINGNYPDGGTTNGPAGISFKVSRNAYATNMHNFIYCVNYGAGNDKFIVAAASKSGKRYAISSDKGLHDYSFAWSAVANVCTNEG